MSNPIRIVLVDDEDTILDLFRRSLEKASDIQVVGVGRNGREAIQLVNSLRPDVIFLDINMPVLNGLEAAARIASRFPRTAIAILTAEQSREFMQQAIRIGVRDYLDKLMLRPGDIPDAVRRIHQSRPFVSDETPDRGLASVWTFYGPKGNAGTTTQAINASVELSLMGYDVLLVDLDLTQGDVQFYLQTDRQGEEADDHLDILSNLEALSDLEEERIRNGLQSFHPQGDDLPEGAPDEGLKLRVLPCPTGFHEPSEAWVENLGSLIELLSTMFDFIVFDLAPGRIFERSSALSLDYSERIFLVSNQDIASLKAVHLFTRSLSRTSCTGDKVSVLLSPILKHPGFDARKWFADLKTPMGSVTEIPFDPATAHKAASSGWPYTLSDRQSELAVHSINLVHKALNQEPVTARSPGLWSRFHDALKGAIGR